MTSLGKAHRMMNIRSSGWRMKNNAPWARPWLTNITFHVHTERHIWYHHPYIMHNSIISDVGGGEPSSSHWLSVIVWRNLLLFGLETLSRERMLGQWYSSSSQLKQIASVSINLLQKMSVNSSIHFLLWSVCCQRYHNGRRPICLLEELELEIQILAVKSKTR